MTGEERTILYSTKNGNADQRVDDAAMPFSSKDVLQAYERIKGHVVRTPLEKSFFLGDAHRSYFFKLESFQRAKSFKIRGALNKLMTLSEEERARGVAAVSSGNHGSSVSYGAALLGIDNVKIIVPETTPRSKIEKIEYFGAQALLMGKDYDEAHALGMRYINEHGLVNIDAYYDDPLVYAGQGTIALEILEQDPDIDTIVVPIGGGGLITGIAVAAKSVKPSIRIIGVQTEACPAMVRAYEDGVFYEEYPSTETICDALVGGIGKLSYQMLKDYVDGLLVVKEESIARAVGFMAKQEKYVLEGASCTTVAAVWEYPDIVAGKNVALVMSGANIDGELLTSLLDRY